MPDETTILSLPLILPAQAQKHVTHNEALAALDLIVQLTVIDRTRTTAPDVPTVGDRHIVAAGATGPWVGQEGRIALLSETGWQFTQPLPGWRAHVLAEAQTAVFDGLGWVALSDGPLEVAELGVSASPDATNRLVVSSPAVLLTHAGAGHQLKLNKATAGDTASLLFQTGFGGRAEMGTAGSDDFSVKVSADGSVWSSALIAAGATGEVTLPQPLHLGGQAADPASPVDGMLWLDTATGEVRVRSAGVTVPLGGGVSDGDKGDITVAGASWTIDAGAVGDAKLAAMPNGTIKGRASAGTGVPENLTGAEVTALLQPFSDMAQGVVPASGGGSAGFLRADGVFAVPPGEPGGGDGMLQYNQAGALGGAVDAGIEGGQLRLPAIATPAAPAAGGVKLFGRSVGGRVMPAFVGPSGLDSSLQPHLGRNRVGIARPVGNNTAMHVQGMLVAAVGTATTAGVTTTNRHSRMARLEYLVTTASASAVVGFRANNLQWTLGASTAGDGGFHMIYRWAPATGVATATHRAFAGMRGAVTAPTDVDPSSLSNLCGMGYDAGDANLQFLHNDASGTASKIDLGAAFAKPTTDRTAVYEIALFAPPGVTQVLGYEVTDLVSGAVASGTVTTDLPGTSQLLAPYSYVSVGGTSSVIGMAVMGLTIESDF